MKLEINGKSHWTSVIVEFDKETHCLLYLPTRYPCHFYNSQSLVGIVPTFKFVIQVGIPTYQNNHLYVILVCDRSFCFEAKLSPIIFS